MKSFLHFKRHAYILPRIGVIGAVLAAFGLLWVVRDAPLVLGSNIYVDALSAFWLLALLGGMALELLLVQPPWEPRRAAAAGVLLLVIYATSNVPAIAVGYVLFALLTRVRRPAGPRRPRSALAEYVRRGAALAPWPLASACLLLGYGALAARGALHYTDRGAGTALASLVFWFVLLAAAIPLVPWRAALVAGPAAELGAWPLKLAWLYPLLRLYTLGPWNTGWSLATLLVGGALAMWSAVAALAEPEPHARSAYAATGYAGLVLAGIGLGSSAGIAAACYGTLAVLVLGAGLRIQAESAPSAAEATSATAASSARDNRAASFAPIGWLLAGIFPFTAPFVAIWMLIGASVAAGVALLAGIGWLVALLSGLTLALWGWPGKPARRHAALALAAISVALGIGAPLLLRATAEPVVAQLQGGLNPYGDIVIWPWVGLAASDAAHTQVATLPSIAIALLMLVLAALVYVALRLRNTYADAPSTSAGAPLDRQATLQTLRDEVPWLGALLGQREQHEEPPRERE